MTSGRTRPLVLLVEDDQDTREMYAMYLDFSGFSSLTASTAQDGFALALEHQPDVVVTDLQLHGAESGADLCARLHAEPRTAHIPALLVTGSVQPRAAAAGAGCAEIRVKPYLPDSLVADLREIIART